MDITGSEGKFHQTNIDVAANFKIQHNCEDKNTNQNQTGLKS